MNTNITLIKDQETLDVSVEEGLRIMDLKYIPQCEKFLQDYECACEGSLACSTCHIILDEQTYSKLNPAGDDENDMLDLAPGLTTTSRLGCQVVLTKELNGAKIRIPLKRRSQI